MTQANDDMPAVEISEPGGPEVLRVVRRPRPQPGHDEVLIEVAAAGINRPDVMQRQGHYPPPPGAPDIPGLEVAGTVVATGAGVDEWRIGDKVCALVAGGAYGGFCTAPQAQCLPVPEGFTMVQAAALPETFFTVWTNVFQRGGLQGGESLLVHGGSSGIGTTAIMLACAFGARVFVTAGSDEKCRACEALGAERAINYRDEDFVAAIAEATQGRGVDLVLDMVGGDYLARNLECLAVDGRLVQIAVQRGPKADGFNLLTVMQKRLNVTGSTLRPRSVAEKMAIRDELLTQVWPLLSAGVVRPVVHAEFPLEQVSEAHALMDSSRHVGKIVLTI